MPARLCPLLLSLALLVACSSAASSGQLANPPHTAIAAPIASRTPPPVASPTMVLPADAPADLSGSIVIDGSSTVFPISETAALAFRTIAPRVEIRLGVSGTGGGFRKFCAGETLISGASRPIKASEAAACAAAGFAFVELPIAFDGLSVVVHPTNTWASCMTTSELRQLWEPAAEGAITRWSQLRTGWPDQPIALYGAGADSGTYDYFTAAVVGEEGASRSDYVGSEDDYLLAQDIAADPSALGFFGYTYYLEHAAALRLVAIDNGAGCVAPSASTIADSSYQPLARPIFIYVRADALKLPEVRAFVLFYLANGAALAAEARAIPLPARAYSLATRRVARLITGSVFAGGSQLGVSIEQLLELEGD